MFPPMMLPLPVGTGSLELHSRLPEALLSRTVTPPVFEEARMLPATSLSCRYTAPAFEVNSALRSTRVPWMSALPPFVALYMLGRGSRLRRRRSCPR